MNHYKTQSGEQGAALVVGLFILLILTLIGVSGMQTTVQEEKMAGNARDYNLAFQAAEAGLIEAERRLEAMVALTDFAAGDPGHLTEGDTVDDTPSYYTDYTTWSSSNSPLKYIQATGDYPFINSKPRIIIRKVTEQGSSANSTLTIGGYGERVAGEQLSIFKVTSRATGSTDGSQVILQTYYGKKF